MITQEPGPGCVLTWFARFRKGGPQYQYAAVHIAGKGWYTTDTIHENPITWAALRLRIGSSPCYAATHWQPIPHALEGEIVTYALPHADVDRLEDALDNPTVMGILPGPPPWR